MEKVDFSQLYSEMVARTDRTQNCMAEQKVIFKKDRIISKKVSLKTKLPKVLIFSLFPYLLEDASFAFVFRCFVLQNKKAIYF